MRFRSSKWRLAVIGLAVVCASKLAAGQSNQEWIAIKQKCNILAGTAYNDWVAAGSKCNSGGTATGAGSGSAEHLGTTLGNITGDAMVQGFHNLLHGPTRPTAPIDPERHQRELAAQQFNNSGIYLVNSGNYAGAINEFEKALQQTPNDATVASNLQYARRLQKEAALAGETRKLLGKQLGDKTPPFDLSKFPYTSPSPNAFNQVNLDPNVVDFRGKFRNSLPATAFSYLPAVSANGLNAVLTGSDSGVVDLSGAEKTSVDPKSLQAQIDGMFGKHIPASEPPSPQAQEIMKLLQPRLATAGTQGLPTEAKPAGAEKLTKEEINNLLSKPDAPPHN
jgi:tetratricopeptide (TPR) repeat protein